MNSSKIKSRCAAQLSCDFNDTQRWHRRQQLFSLVRSLGRGGYFHILWRQARFWEKDTRLNELIYRDIQSSNVYASPDTVAKNHHRLEIGRVTIHRVSKIFFIKPPPWWDVAPLASHGKMKPDIRCYWVCMLLEDVGFGEKVIALARVESTKHWERSSSWLWNGSLFLVLFLVTGLHKDH